MSAAPQAPADPQLTTLKSRSDYVRLKHALSWHAEGAVVDVTFTSPAGGAAVLYGRIHRRGRRVCLADAIDERGRKHWATEVELADDTSTPHFHLCLVWPVKDPDACQHFGLDPEEQTTVLQRYQREVGFHD
jgi:hypothetical protein